MDSRLSSLLPKFAAVPLAFLLYVASSPAMADTYNLPADLKKSPFNCSGSGQDYNCGSIDLDKDAVLVLNGPIRLQVSGNFSTDKNLSSVNNGYSFDISVGGSVDLKKDVDVTMNLTVGGSVDIAKDARFTGNITAGGNATFAKDSIYDGNVTVGGFLSVDKNTYITGTCRAGATNFAGCGAKPPASTLHHIRINHNGGGLTCQPSTVTIYACTGNDSAGTCTPYTGGASGSVQAIAGGVQASTNFTIPSGSSSTTANISVTTAQTVLLGIANQSPTSTTGATCWNGSAADCSHDFADTGFKFDVPNHQSATEQIVPVTALYKNPKNNQQCSVAYANVTRQLTFSCNYTNPASGTKTVSLSDANTAQAPTTACTAGGSNLNLSFNGGGQASLKLVYPDVGQINIAALDTGSTLKGSDSFIAAPASYRVNPTPSTSYLVAGKNFAVTVSALNFEGKVADNFGKESPLTVLEIGLSKCVPAAGYLGIFTKASGKSNETIQPLSWSESGKAVLTATPMSGQNIVTYLSSGVAANVPGCASAVDFVPHHFEVAHTGSRLFYYSGEKIDALTITAFNAQNSITKNYMLDQLTSNITLSTFDKDGNAVSNGKLEDYKLDSGDKAFTDGVATIKPKYTFTNKKTAPLNLRVRADEKDRVSSKGYKEDSVTILTGRLRLSNAFGGASTVVPMRVRAEYWNGSNWLWNTQDNYTKITRQSVALTPYPPPGSNFTANVLNDLALSNGEDTLRLSSAYANKGYVDVALNLALNAGAETLDQSCLATHKKTQGSDTPWLRSWYGACSAGANPENDPSARANFGVTAPETRATIFVREVFN